jgi:hypothetical protein
MTRSARLAALRGLPVWALLLLGLLGGGGVGLIIAGLADRADEPAGRFVLQPASEGAQADQQAARDGFLTAWRRSREASYTAQLVFVRVATDGRELRSTSTVTQQPPRRIVRSADAVQLDAGAASVTCSTVNGAFLCTPAPAKDYTALVDEELAVWRTALDGDRPWYRISSPVEGCFELALAQALTDPPYGTISRFCFDATTGALAKRQIVRTGATDTEEALDISSTIPADAFAPPVTTPPTTATR